MSVVSLLKANGITVISVEDVADSCTPESIFPGGWFSTHEDGTLVIYPMALPSRRDERKSEFIDAIRQNFDIRRIIDLTHWEEEGEFLEGTQSMALDRAARVLYACRSEKTSEKVIADFCKRMDYRAVIFDARDAEGRIIEHTDRVMSVGENFAVVCLAAISTPEQRDAVVSSLKKAKKAVVEITREQMDRFAGKVMELHNGAGRKFLLMSGNARKSLSPEQTRMLGNGCRILSPELDSIESSSGGSAGRLTAELF